MPEFAYEAADRFAECLDFFRSRALRATLQIKWLRPWFYTRSQRLLVLFLSYAALSLALSLCYPLWVLLVGPLLYGVPHVFSSLRYFHYAVGDGTRAVRSSRTYILVGAVLIAVFSYRLLFNSGVFNVNLPQMSEWKGSTYLELGALALTFLFGVIFYRKPTRQVLIGLAWLIPFAVFFVRYPAWTIGALVLIHNFVAFAYWILATRDRADRRTAWWGLFITLGVSAIIFGGGFDWLSRLMPTQLILNFADLSISNTGQMIAPWSANQSLWLHACIAFAFGQSVHYFVWLKAIPDQYHYHDVPTSFRQSLGLLASDFGKIGALLLITLSVGSVIVWSFMSFQQARLIYFCLASYHGYLEIAGLGLFSVRDN